MQSDKTREAVLVTIIEQLIVRQVSGCNSQAMTAAIIRLFKGIKNANSIAVNYSREFSKYDEIK